MTAALAIAGCSKENAPAADDGGTTETVDLMTIGAVMGDSPDGTKTVASDNGDKTYSVFWADGDEIVVNGKTSRSIDIDQDDRKSAVFTMDVVDAPYCAVYPAGAYVADSYKVDADTVSMTVTLPKTQKYVADGFDPSAALMCAYTKTAAEGLSFRHSVAYLKLTVEGAAVKSVRVNGNNNDALCGDFTVKFSGDGVSLTPVKSGNASVTLSAEDAAVPAGAPMFIAIPAIGYEDGLTLTIVDDQNHYQVVRSSAKFEAFSGKVYPTSVTFKADGTYVQGGIYTAEDWNAFITDMNAGDYSRWVTTIANATGVHVMADISYRYNLVSSAADAKATLQHIVYGHDHTITHHPVRQMFTYIGENGGVFNLTIAGETDKWDNTGWAGIFALNNSGQLRKCVSKVNLNLGKASSGQNAVLAAGICRTNSATGYVMDCRNEGTITVSSPDKKCWVGGVLLYNDGGNFARCTNEGRIEITGVDVECAVGGVAYATGGIVSELENHGDISIDAALTARRPVRLGGVIANAEYNGKCTKLTSCKNSGALSIHKTGAFVMTGGAIGGVVAAINAGVNGSEGGTFTGFTNCSNSGAISFVEEETETAHFGYAVGGVLGRCVNVASGDPHYLQNGYYMVMRGAENTGDISVYTANGQKAAVGNSGARQTYVGGVAGYVSGYSAVVDGKTVVNNAVVRGKSTCTITSGSALGGDMVGGLVGGGAMLSIDTAPSAQTVFKSYEGKPMGFLGAVLGWNASKGNAVIKDAAAVATFETGSVKPLATGFAGVTGGKTLTVTGCKYNGAAVTAADIYGNGTKTVN